MVGLCRTYSPKGADVKLYDLQINWTCFESKHSEDDFLSKILLPYISDCRHAMDLRFVLLTPLRLIKIIDGVISPFYLIKNLICKILSDFINLLV